MMVPWLAPGTSCRVTSQPRPFRKALRATDAAGSTVSSAVPATNQTGTDVPVA